MSFPRSTRTTLDTDEIRVAEALAAYKAELLEPDATSFSWVPTRVLIEQYVHWMSRHDPNGYILCDSMFGRALRRVFGVERRSIRHYQGRRQWGVEGLKGPGSIRVSNTRGRRAKSSEDADKAPAPAAEVQGGAAADPG
jgi:hypothetical protein